MPNRCPTLPSHACRTILRGLRPFAGSGSWSRQYQHWLGAYRAHLTAKHVDTIERSWSFRIVRHYVLGRDVWRPTTLKIEDRLRTKLYGR